MQAVGFVERRRNPNDERQVFIELTGHPGPGSAPPASVGRSQSQRTGRDGVEKDAFHR